MTMLTAIIEFFYNHKLFAAVVAFLCARALFFGRGGKFEEYPGNKVLAISSKGVFSDALMAAKQNNQLVVVDFFATWCPPCRAANPIVGKMSLGWCPMKIQ